MREKTNATQQEMLENKDKLTFKKGSIFKKQRRSKKSPGRFRNQY